VNLWFFMQRLNLIKHVVNLKYGLGIEMNNYRFKEPVKFETEPNINVIMDESTHYKKNKLAADYVTIPMMLNFNFTPRREKGFGLSVGASAGYLYASRQKTITDADGKRKKRDDFDLNPWKLSYIAELGLGPVKLYGSYASESIFEKGLDLTPYSVGIRLSSW
jgi:Outer membrane protein beta-barrel domain